MSVPRALDRSIFVEHKVAGLKGAALSQAAGERSLLEYQTSNNNAFAGASSNASAGEHRHANATCANAFDFADALDKNVGHAGRIYEFGRYLGFQDHHPPSGISSAALGLREISQIGSERRVKVGGASS